MMKRKFAKVFSCTLLLAVALCGCGNSDSNTADNAINTQSEEEVAKEQSISYYLKKGQSIWYYINNGSNSPGKDSEVRNVCVFQDGQVTVYRYYSTDMHTLGDYAKMSDEQILAQLKEEDIQKEEKTRQHLIEKAKETIKASESELHDKRFANYYEGIRKEKETAEKQLPALESYEVIGRQPNRYILNLVTDETGNRTTQEIIHCAFKPDSNCWTTYDEDGNERKSSVDIEDFTLSYVQSSFQIYETFYLGFGAEESYGSSYSFVTRDQGTQLLFDEPGEEGIRVDEKERTIHDELRDE